jgi:hypothetical protein
MQSSNEYIQVPRFKINLDDNPEDRWDHIINIYKTKFDGIMKVMDNLLQGINGTALSWLTWMYSDKVFYINELRGISEKAGIELEKLIILQLCYELFACCTSVIINENDKIIHYRTMDWEMPELKELTIELDFIKNGKHLFRATSWAGYVGVMTCIKPNVCTIALNYRRIGDSVLTNLNKSVTGSWPVGFLIRHLMETENSYDKIKDYLSHSALISPCYLTIGGVRTGEGVVLCRTRDSVDKIQTLGKTNHNFLVQTNIDYDYETNKSVANIMYSQQRIRLVKNIMKDYDKTNDLKTIIQRFNIWPIINETTVYVTIMCCNDNRMYSYTCYPQNLF